MADGDLVPTFHSNLDGLSPGTAALFDAASDDSFFLSLPWFRTLTGHGFETGGELRLYVTETARGRAGLAAWSQMGSAAWRPRTLKSLTNFYSCGFAPLTDAPASAEAIQGLIEFVVSDRPKWDVINLDSLDRDDPCFALLTEAFSRRGWPMQSYFHFGNWYEDTAGLSSADYFAARPGNLRSTLKRQAARLAKSATATYRMFAGQDVDEAIALYEAVYARSWKEPEPFPTFAAALIRTCAALGCLRLGVLLIDGAPAAAQIWIVWRGKATIFKLAHDERFTTLSPGSLLMRHMMEHVLGEGEIREVDFGRGDDAYKRLWLPKRRERWGLAAFNPSTLRGRLAALRHIGGAAARRTLAGVTGRRDAR